MQVKRRLVVNEQRAAVLAVVLSSCGGDGGSPPAEGPFATGLSASATLDSLGGSDAETLCRAFQGLLPRLSNCPGFGMLAAFNLAFDENYDDGGALPTDRRLQTACSETRRQCEEALRDSVTNDDVMNDDATSDSPANCSGAFSGCSGTVQQFEVCINDFLSVVEVQSDSTPSCEGLRCSTFSDSARQWVDVTQASTAAVLPSCQVFFATCPPSGPALSPPKMSPPNEGSALDELPPLVCGE